MIFYQLLIQFFIYFDGQLFAVFVFIIPNDEVFFLTVYIVQQILRLYEKMYDDMIRSSGLAKQLENSDNLE